VLKITADRQGNSLSLRLEGRVEGLWVELLRKTWADEIVGDEREKSVVDLGGVTFADSEGQKLLVSMKKQGVALIKPSPFMRELLKCSGSNLNCDNH
jgi:anti-anti-sigma regulatory factor